jgi:hypothetical protein
MDRLVRQIEYKCDQRERMALVSGHGTTGRAEQLARMERDLTAHTAASSGNGGCFEVGEPAGVVFDTAARDDQHEYFDKSQRREVGHGISRAAPGAPPLETPNSGRWDRPGFVPVVASPCA